MKILAKILISLSILLGASILTKAQTQYDLNQGSQEAMKILSFMEGNWKGSGWMMGEDRQKHTFDQTEEVRFKLSGTSILIEGKGISNGKVIHHALAVISPGTEPDSYSFSSFLQSGRKGTYQAELKGDDFYWHPSDQVRYIIHLNEQGQWYEKGEYKMGENWFQFFEMTLDKVLDPD